MDEMQKTRKLVWAALFTALTTVATMVIRVPTPLGGYANAGDALVILSAFLLGPAWGALAAGVGSALADIFSGYILYAPATLVIKALMALAAGVILRAAKRKNPPAFALLGSVCAEVLMVAGYLAYEAFVLPYGWGALANVPANAVQGVFGALAGTALFYALLRIPYVRKTF